MIIMARWVAAAAASSPWLVMVSSPATISVSEMPNVLAVGITFEMAPESPCNVISPLPTPAMSVFMAWAAVKPVSLKLFNVNIKTLDTSFKLAFSAFAPMAAIFKSVNAAVPWTPPLSIQYMASPSLSAPVPTWTDISRMPCPTILILSVDSPAVVVSLVMSC